MVSRALIILLLFVFTHVGIYADEIRLVPKGMMEVQSLGRAPIQVKDPTDLKANDRINVQDGRQAEIHFPSGVGGTMGGDATVLLEKKELAGWDKIFLVEGTAKLFGGSLPLVVATPVCTVHVFNGPVLLMVEQAVTLVMPQGQQGVMISTSQSVDSVPPGQMAIIKKDGRLVMLNVELPPIDFVEDREESREGVLLSQSYRRDVFKQFGALVVPDMNQASALLEAKSYKLYFKTPIDALEQITEMYYKHTRKSLLISEGKEILFAQLLFGSRNYDQIIPEALYKSYADGPERDELLSHLKVADAELAKFTSNERHYVTALFRRHLVDRMLPEFKIKDQISYNFRETLQYDSNVTQTPDEQQAVSDSSGTSLLSILGLSFTGRKRNFGEPSVKLSYTDLTYFKEEFTNRETNSIALSVRDSLKLRKDKFINTIAPQFSYARNFLNTSLGRYDAFDVASPQFQIVYKRLEKPWAMSDYIIFVNTFGYEFRNYFGLEQYDFRSKKKDVIASFFTLTGISLKKMESHMAKSTFLFNIKQFSSDSNELDYKTIQFNLMHTFDFPKISCDISYNFNRRWQPVYLSLGDRVDLTHTISLGTKLDFFQRRGTFGVNFKHEIQDSSIPQFNYVGNQSTMYYSYSF